MRTARVRETAPVPADAAKEPRRIRRARQGLRWVLVALLVLIAVMVVAGLVISRQINDDANARYVDDAIPLKTAVQDLGLAITSQQSEVRAYVISGDPARAAGYRAGRDERGPAWPRSRRGSTDIRSSPAWSTGRARRSPPSRPTSRGRSRGWIAAIAQRRHPGSRSASSCPTGSRRRRT